MTWDPVSAGEPRGKGGKQGRQAKGRRAIPKGVATAVQAEALARKGEPGAITEIAERYGVGRWYVANLAKTARMTDPDQVAVLRRTIPSRMTVAVAGFTEQVIESLAEGDVGTATKAMFGAKLGSEAIRHMQPAAENPGATIQAFIQALHVNINVGDAVAAAQAVDAESVRPLLPEESEPDAGAMP